MRHRHQSRWQPTRAAAQRLSDQCPQPGKKHSRWVRTGRPPGAPILLHVYLPTAEATKKGRRRLKPLKGHTSRCNLFRVIWKWQQHLVDIFGAHPPSAAESGGDRAHGPASTRSGHGRPAWCSLGAGNGRYWLPLLCSRDSARLHRVTGGTGKGSDGLANLRGLNH